MKKVAFYSLGCKVNQYESEAVSSIFQSKGFEVVDYSSFADVYVINTCTVTGLSDRKNRQIIRRAKKINPEAIVAVMGCYSQVKPEEVAAISDIDIIIGTKDRDKLADMCLEYKREPFDVVSEEHKQIVDVSDSMKFRDFEELKIDTFKGHSRAFLKIQDGCTQFCTYCIIPYARGPVRSREPANIIEEIKRLVDVGYKEFVLTGIHLASYGRDLRDINLVKLLKNLLNIDGVERLRLGSVEPSTLSDEFIELAASSTKMCRHFHVSLQSGSNNTLKRMNRKYSAEEYYDNVCKLKARIDGVAITTDIIVGFPGETDEDFEETMDFAEKVNFSKIHVFKYSPREGTPAADMENQIHDDTKEQRSSQLIALSDRMSKAFIEKYRGTNVSVLFEQYVNNHTVEGLTDTYVRVLCDVGDKPVNIGSIYDVKIIGAESDYATGILI